MSSLVGELDIIPIRMLPEILVRVSKVRRAFKAKSVPHIQGSLDDLLFKPKIQIKNLPS